MVECQQIIPRNIKSQFLNPYFTGKPLGQRIAKLCIFQTHVRGVINPKTGILKVIMGRIGNQPGIRGSGVLRRPIIHVPSLHFSGIVKRPDRITRINCIDLAHALNKHRQIETLILHGDIQTIGITGNNIADNRPIIPVHRILVVSITHIGIADISRGDIAKCLAGCTRDLLIAPKQPQRLITVNRIDRIPLLNQRKTADDRSRSLEIDYLIMNIRQVERNLIPEIPVLIAVRQFEVPAAIAYNTWVPSVP